MNTSHIILAGGCFWCLEAVYQKVNGVLSSTSGYIGGKYHNPTYEQVCGGQTGHAEAVKLEYDPAVIPLEAILEIFFEIHDPTTLNQQGADTGTQYRSAIFYSSPNDLPIIEAVMARQQEKHDKPIVTEINQEAGANFFYKAEEYHQNYYPTHPDEPYCTVIISPKLQKFLKTFPTLVKN